VSSSPGSPTYIEYLLRIRSVRGRTSFLQRNTGARKSVYYIYSRYRGWWKAANETAICILTMNVCSTDAASPSRAAV
jgi:hypothetical protein